MTTVLNIVSIWLSGFVIGTICAKSKFAKGVLELLKDECAKGRSLKEVIEDLEKKDESEVQG